MVDVPLVLETMFYIDGLITSNVQFFMTPTAFKAEVSSELISTRKIRNKSYAGSEQTVFFLRKPDECAREGLIHLRNVFKA